MTQKTASAKRALVTGASGFIGSHLTRRLISDAWDVHVVVRPKTDLYLLSDVADRLTIHRHDGTTQQMVDLLTETRPDTVFHLASLFLASHDHDDVSSLINSNVLFGTQVVEAMVAGGCTKLVNTGTTWQHFESSSYRPVCLYAATKQAFESVLAYYCDAANINVTTLKLPDTYGEGDPRRKLIQLLASAARTGSTLEMSAGEQLIDIVHVDDVVEAYLAAVRLLDSGQRGHTSYQVSSGKPLDLRSLVAAYELANATKVPVRWGARDYRDREVMTPWDEGEPIPGWHPRVPLNEGLCNVFATPVSDGRTLC